MKNLKKFEDFEYQLVDKDGKPITVSKEEFIEAGASNGMKTARKSLMTIDHVDKKIIAKFESYQINEGLKENILVGILSLFGAATMGQNKEVPINKQKYTTSYESTAKSLIKQGWSLDSSTVDTLFQEIKDESPNSEIMVTKLKLDKDQHFQSGKYELSQEMKDEIANSLDEILNGQGVIVDVFISSSTDKQGLSKPLQKELVILGHTPDNKGLSEARNDEVADYLLDYGINVSLITIKKEYEKGGEIDPDARYVNVDIYYILKSPLPEIPNDDPKISKKFYLSKVPSGNIGKKRTGENVKVEKLGVIKNHTRKGNFKSYCVQPGMNKYKMLTPPTIKKYNARKNL